MPRLVRIRSHGEVDPVGEPGARRPDLVAVDDVAIVTPHGAGRQRGEVASRPGLREPLAERELAPRDRRKQPLLERRRAEALERAADRLVREEVQREREPVVAEHVLDERGVDVRESAATELLRPRHPDPACPPERARDLTRVAVGEHPLAPPLGIVEQRGRRPAANAVRLLAQRRSAPVSAEDPRAAIVERHRISPRGAPPCLDLDGGRHAARRTPLPPDVLPAPVIVDALPYRMDDLTASYASEYERLCQEGGFAVCRLDLRGTGSSEGIALDEYHPQEQADICEVIAWLAAQDWCTGSVGMYGTSWGGFNSLQVAMERPPALHAIVPIYASDDRYTDDVHYMGGILKAIDLVDWVVYMAACNVLPPVPAVFGDGWREEWRRRIDGTEPWLLRWLEEQDDGPYWRHGSLRPGYERITCPTMIVAGWADGYTNIALRAYEAMTCPRRVIIGPWAHTSPATSIPGPHIDLVPELIRWFARWLRDERNGIDEEPPIAVFVRRSTRPAPDLAEMRGEWRSEPTWPTERSHEVWNPTEPRGSDRRSRRRRHRGVDLVRRQAPVDASGRPARGRCPLADLRVGAARGRARGARPPARSAHRDLAHPVAFLSARLCDVFPDGASALVCRGVLNLTHRGGQPRRGRSSRVSHPGGARARVDIVDLRAGPSRAPRAGRIGLAEHVAASPWGRAQGAASDGRAGAPGHGRSTRRRPACLPTTSCQGSEVDDESRSPPVVRRIERDRSGGRRVS